jgi:hypothetical protein
VQRNDETQRRAVDVDAADTKRTVAALNTHASASERMPDVGHGDAAGTETLVDRLGDVEAIVEPCCANLHEDLLGRRHARMKIRTCRFVKSLAAGNERNSNTNFRLRAVVEDLTN